MHLRGSILRLRWLQDLVPISAGLVAGVVLLSQSLHGSTVFDDTFSTDTTNPNPAGTSGWTYQGDVANQALATCSYDTTNSALRVVPTSPTNKQRVNGFRAGNDLWIPYSAIVS